MNIKEIKEKIQQLINQATSDNNNLKNRLSFLFDKLNEIKELETMERLKDFAGGKLLTAYLLYKSIVRANYQPEHLSITNFEKNADKYLEAIGKDIELLEPKEEKKQPTNEQLLIMLSEKIETGEIKNKCSVSEICDILYLEDETGKKTMKLYLETGKIEPDPAEELLKKHGWIEKDEKKQKYN